MPGAPWGPRGVARRLPKYAPIGPGQILQTQTPMLDFTLKADGPRLDGAATLAAGASFAPKEGGGRAQKISPGRATPVPGEAVSWEGTTTASSFI